MGGALVAFEDLTKRYGAHAALDGVTLRIEEGIVALLGPNGAGKSTLIKVLLGLIPPTSGRGEVLGLDIARRRDQLRIRQRVGYMPEMDCHLPGLNAVQAVSLCGELTGMPRSEAMQRAHEALYYVGIAEERYREVAGYSTGMRQRVKLAQALVHSPDLVFLDEPTNGLDPRGREVMLGLIRRIWTEKKISVILSSHLLPDVERTCDRVVVLHRGKVRLTGDIAELRRMGRASWRVQVADREAAFLEEIAALGWAHEREGERLLRVTPAGGEPSPERGTAALFAAAARAGAPIRRLEPREASLEERFFEAVGSA